MQFLTREWASGALSDQEWDQRWNALEHHVSTIRPTLGNGAELLIEDVNLHDAVPKSWSFGPEFLTIRFVAGDLQRSYEFVELEYADAEVLAASRDEIVAWLSSPHTEVWYDEVDRHEVRYIHRYLLHPEGEFEIEFSNLQVHREPAQPSDR